MHRRALRHGLVALLFVTAAGAAAFAWSVDQQLARPSRPRSTRRRSRFDTLVQSIARFDAAQQRLRACARARDRLVRSRQAAPDADRVGGQGAAHVRGVRLGRAHLRRHHRTRGRGRRKGRGEPARRPRPDGGRPGAGRSASRAPKPCGPPSSSGAPPRATPAETARTALVQQLWMVLGGTLAFWAIGVLLLAPRQTAAAPAAAASLSILAEPAGEMAIAAPALAAPALAAPTQPAPSIADVPAVDLVPAAELCADIARADSGETLDDARGSRGGRDRRLRPRGVACRRRRRARAGARARIRSPGSRPARRAAAVRGERDHARVALGSAAVGGWRLAVAGGARGPDVPGTAPHRCAGGGVGGRRVPGPLPRALTSILAAQFATALSPQPEPAARTRRSKRGSHKTRPRAVPGKPA